ncbi:MAG: GNAT family N-acetyltransferase [Planctomycetota bacterium]
MLRITPLSEEHLEDAALLVRDRYQVLRDQDPLLPLRYGEVSNLLPLLRDIVTASGPGVAAARDGRLVGFLKAWLMPAFRGKRSVYSPEWANAADLDDSRHIYEEMYRHLSAAWVADGHVAHYISVFANDIHAVEAWHWLGFGMAAVDALRGLQPVEAAGATPDIRRAGIQDTEKITQMEDALRRYSRAAPDFFIAEAFGKKDCEAWIADPDRVIWLACVDSEPVAFLRMGPAADDVCTIIRDAKTASIHRAFTRETVRGQGIATALLDRGIAWARSRGYVRCAVDFESMNLLATRFWLRHFRPVCFSLFRHIDERVT